VTSSTSISLISNRKLKVIFRTMKMRDRNEQLKTALGAMAPKERVAEVMNLRKEDSKNRQGLPAYSLTDELRLLSMLNTLKIQNQYYRDEDTMLRELRDLVERIGMKNPYFVAQAIVWSRCMGEGMRNTNQLAAALAAPFVAGRPWSKAFYSLWDKKMKQGGVVYRPDDMQAIKDSYAALNKSPLSNAMKKGFASALVKLDNYSLAKYRDTVIDISNLVHPKSSLSKATIRVNGEEMKTIDAIMRGITISADTWEVAQSDAGQEVAKAVREGKITKAEAEKVLEDAKNSNWEQLLNDGKLGILAALRNIRNMLVAPKREVIGKLCELVSDGKKIRDGLIMPYQIDIAYMVVENEFPHCEFGYQVREALRKGYAAAVPNLALAMPGKTLCVVDTSGSMSSRCSGQSRGSSYNRRCINQAALMASTIAKGTNGDIMVFSDYAKMYVFRRSDDVFSIAESIVSTSQMGGTNIPDVFEKLRIAKAKYDRIIILSDNECNRKSYYYGDWVSGAYAKYVHDVCSPYVYCVDLAAYGATILPQTDKIGYYFGYGYSMLEDIAKLEFNPMAHLDKVRAVVIDPQYKPTKEDLS